MTVIRSRFAPLALALIAALALAACASTRFISQWSNDQFVGRKFDKILVVGIVRDVGLRRQFEDDFVRQAQARGINAVQAYRYLPEDGVQSEARLKQAVAESGADGVVVSVVKKVDQQTQVSPGMVMPPPVGFGYYGFYSYGWGASYIPPTVYTYDVIYIETQLHSVRPEALVWTGTTRTTDPSIAANEIPPFVKLILDALTERRLV